MSRKVIFFSFFFAINCFSYTDRDPTTYISERELKTWIREKERERERVCVWEAHCFADFEEREREKSTSQDLHIERRRFLIVLFLCNFWVLLHLLLLLQYKEEQNRKNPGLFSFNLSISSTLNLWNEFLLHYKKIWFFLLLLLFLSSLIWYFCCCCSCLLSCSAFLVF